MRNEPQPGILTWLIIIAATCLLLFLFQAVLWLVIPALLALVVYYCLQPLTQALIRAGLRHGTAAKVVAGVLFLATVLVLFMLFSVAASHAESWKATTSALCARRAGFPAKDRGMDGAESAVAAQVAPLAELRRRPWTPWGKALRRSTWACCCCKWSTGCRLCCSCLT